MQTQTQNTVESIGRTRAMEFLTNETQGRIFSAYFKKADGSMRTMVCRRGVKQHLRGGSLPYNPKQRHLLPVWDFQKREYRMVNLASLVSFNIGGETFIVMD